MRWNGFLIHGSKIMRSSALRAAFLWATAGAPLIISISLVVSTGALVQEYILALIYSDSPSIYGSSYQDTLIKFPQLDQWLLAGLQWPFIIIASCIVAFSLRRSSTRGLFISGILASFLSLVAYDGVSAAFNRTLSAAYIMENVIADAFGSVVIGFILLTVAIVANLCFVHLPGSCLWRRSVAAFVVIFIGTILNAAIFFVAAFFYKPVPVKLDIVIDQPVRGQIFSEIDSARDNAQALTIKTKQDEENRPFQLFPTTVHGVTLSWVGDKLLVQWNSIATKSTFDAAIGFFADCRIDQINTSKIKESDVLRIGEISNLSVSFDPGLTEFNTTDFAKVSGQLAASLKSPVIFQMDRHPDTKQLEVTQFVGSRSAITIVNDERDLAFYLNAPLAVDSDGSLIDSARTLHLEINESSHLIEAAKPDVKVGNSVPECKAIAPQGVIGKSQGAVTGSETAFGVLIRINKKPASVYGGDDSELKVFGDSGWITLNNMQADEWTRGEAGLVSSVGLKGNVVSLEIDGSPATPHSTDYYFAFGELRGSFEEPTKIRFSGTAVALWKNGARANPTKWERLRWEQRLYILGLTLTALGLILRVVTVAIQKDDKLQWLSSIEESGRSDFEHGRTS
jgi:hypothetical protein